MSLDTDRVERLAAELRALPADSAVRLRHLLAAWPDASGAEIEAVAASARPPALRMIAGKLAKASPIISRISRFSRNAGH